MEKRKFLAGIILVVIQFLAAINSFAQIANTISPADKVFGLSRFWQEVNYNFVYLNKIDRHVWDSTYKALIPEVEATKNDYDYYRLLEKFCALLKDGHTGITMPAIEGINYMNNMFGDYLLVLKQVDSKVIIKRTWKKDVDKFPLGSEIIEVNGLPVERFMSDSVASYISSSTDYVRTDIAAASLLGGFTGSTFSIKIKKPGGEVAGYSLTHARTKDSVFAPGLGIYLDEQDRDKLEYKPLAHDIAYVALNSFSDAKIDTLFENLLPSLTKSKAIIIDLRYNGGGDDGIAFNILRHFIKDSMMVGSSSTVRSLDPYRQAIGRYVKPTDTIGQPDKRTAWLLYNGYAVYDEPGHFHSKIEKGIVKIMAPVVLLTSINTASAAEDFVIAADNQKHIVRIGGRTYGSTGMPYTFDLPGGGSARICVKKDMYPDGREFVGYGIPPHILVAPTVKEYLENKDVVLETAIKYLTKNNPDHAAKMPAKLLP